MTKFLQSAIKEVSKLPASQQDKMARIIHEVMTFKNFFLGEPRDDIDVLEDQLDYLKSQGQIHELMSDAKYWKQILTLVDKLRYEEFQLRKELFPNG